MRVPLFNMISKARLSWLLGLMLLMPLAQTVANWHLIAHTYTQAAQRSDDSSTGFEDYCDLCQTALAMSAGVLPSHSAVTPTVDTPIDVPRAAPVTAQHAPAWPPYASRAPPVIALN